MKRRILSLVFAVVILTAALLQTGFAAETAHFSPVRTYQGQFTDVDTSDWYYKNVAALYELGLTDGQGSKNLYVPAGNITIAEALTMAARLRSLYEYGDSEKGPAAHHTDTGWYHPYVNYLKSLSVIGDEFDGIYSHTANRAQVAHILANVLPRTLFTGINDEAVTVGYASRRYIQDVNEYTPYQQDILSLYRWGILSGTDGTGSFQPQSSITRGEISAMITRLVDSDLRITLDWDIFTAYSKAGTTLADLVTCTGAFHTAPAADDTKAIDDNLRYMLSRGERRMVLSYEKGTLTSAVAEDILAAFLDAVRSYAEQGYNEVQCSYSTRTGSMALTFSSSLYEDRMIDTYREATMEAAIEIHDRLWKDGYISSDMSEYEKARAYFTWLCGNCRYDYHSTETSLSHSGYSALVEGLAVCDGYTAAYNLLLKLEGISCSTASTDDHIWTVAVLDGKTYHIDPTWGDQATSVDYRYFAMSQQEAMGRFA